MQNSSVQFIDPREIPVTRYRVICWSSAEERDERFEMSGYYGNAYEDCITLREARKLAHNDPEAVQIVHLNGFGEPDRVVETFTVARFDLRIT